MKPFRKTQEAEGRVVIHDRQRRAASSTPPTTLLLNGVNVHFPFKPYACQEAYMGKVMEALFRSENALLESPTGTGKTLCLLCATLAWQREQARLLSQAADVPRDDSRAPQIEHEAQDNRRRVPTIIYASRTHSQLTQVVRELKTTRYRPQHAILGSREQMCINPKVKTAHASASDINHDCNRLGKDRKCRYRNNLENFAMPIDDSGSGGGTQMIQDIEELVAMGQKNKVCPFYFTRSQVERAELILLPYNYLFDKDARATTLSEIAWDDAVVIFDEAHNLESFASESASFDLSNGDIAGCISEVNKAMAYAQALQDAAHNLNMDNLLRLKATFMKLEEYLLNLGQQTAYAGEFMMNFFRQGSGIHHANHEIFIEEVRKVNDLIMDLRGTGASKAGGKLEHFVHCLKRVFGNTLESRCVAKAAFYRVHVSPKNKDGSRTVSYWCFAPALAMEELAGLKVRSILVTSGTLAPLESYAMELGLPFPNRLENPHIIGDHQIHVRVIGKGVTGKILNSSYQRRQDDEYYTEMGNTLVALARIVPAGMLIFFPSYAVMETCLERWGGPTAQRSFSAQDKKKNFFAARKKVAAGNQYSFPMTSIVFSDTSSNKTPWKRLLALKAIVLEPRTSADLPDAMFEFKRYLSMPKSKGCILMGVCRGKISEGIDFSNEMSRAVVITGIPFAPSHDAKVKLKREFLDNARATSKFKARGDSGFGVEVHKDSSLGRLSGNDWYTQQAHRAVNQAVGRIIRNRNDYGAVILLDSRFGDKRNQDGLSKWIRPHVQGDEGYGAANRSLIQFYKRCQVAEELKPKPPAEPPTKKEDKEENDDITRVAFIRNGTNESEVVGTNIARSASAIVSSEDDNYYFAPDRVIARVDVNDMKQKSNTDRSALSTEQEESFQWTKPGNKKMKQESVFKSMKRKKESTKPANSQNPQSNEVAMAFMKKLTESFSTADQSTIKKLIKALKQSGIEKDSATYLKVAQDILRTICNSEIFENQTGPRTVILFCRLQPAPHRKTLEQLAMKTVYEVSKLAKLSSIHLSQLDAGRLQTGMVTLLVSLWCDEDASPELKKDFLREVQFLLKIVHKAEKGASAIVESLVKLLPEKYRPITNALSDEVVATKTIHRLRETDKSNRGESTVKSSTFQHGRIPVFSQKDIANTIKTEPSSALPPKPSAEVECKPAPIQKRKVDPASHNSTVAPTNPYAKKKKVPAEASVFSKPLESHLKKFESEPYIEKRAADIRRSINSNAPKGLTCPLCSNKCNQPFVSECGHMACLSCWLQWLRRSSSCPTCRKEGISRQSLAQAVFQNGSVASVPTLSQLFTGESNDELQID